MNFLKAFVKFVPVIILAVLMIAGQNAMIAAPIAFICAVIVAMTVAKKKWQECLDSAMGSVKNILVALFILMLAYVMANCFMAFGVGASVVNIALKLGVTAGMYRCSFRSNRYFLGYLRSLCTDFPVVIPHRGRRHLSDRMCHRRWCLLR